MSISSSLLFRIPHGPVSPSSNDHSHVESSSPVDTNMISYMKRRLKKLFSMTTPPRDAPKLLPTNPVVIVNCLGSP